MTPTPTPSLPPVFLSRDMHAKSCIDLALCPPFDMSHGDYTVHYNSSDRWMEGTQLDIVCDSGYRVVSVTVSCNSEGHWEPQSPECLRKLL